MYRILMTAEMTTPGDSMEPYVRNSHGGAPADDDPKRCTAKSKQSGERCRRWSMENQHVCPFHGGKSPNAKQKAQITLFDLLPIATRRHKEVLETSRDERVILKATEMIYDRTGLEAKTGIAGDGTVVRELVLSQFLQTKDAVAGTEEDSEDEDIVEAEIVDDDDPYDGLI